MTNPERIYVWYTMGSCIFQSHDCDLEICETLEKAREFVQGLQKRDSDVTWAIIRGVGLEEG